MTAFYKNLPSQEQLQKTAQQSQHDLLPIVAGCLLGIIALSLMRDLFTPGIFLGIGLVSYYLVCFLVLVTIWCARQSERTPREWSNTLGAICLACVALNPVVETLNGVQVGPLYFCAVLFGGGLTVLSIRHLLSVQAISIALWLAASLMLFPVSKVLPLLIMNLVAAGLGLATLNKRIGTQSRMHSMAARIATLESILPTCAGCQRVSGDQGEWLEVECYIANKGQELLANRIICPLCIKQHYDEIIQGIDLDPKAASKAIAMKIN